MFALYSFYSANSLKQQSAGRQCVPFWLINLIQSQPVFVLAPSCCMLSKEATDANFIVLCMSWPGLESKIYRIRGEHANHYTTNAVEYI